MLKIYLIIIICAVNLSGQNEHLSAIDIDYLNYTKEDILSGFENSDRFKLVRYDPDMLIFQGGDCYLNWPLHRSEYYFDQNDILTEINLTLADTTEDDVYVFIELLMTFRNWYGNEMDYEITEDGYSNYYWYFGEEGKEAEVRLSVRKNMNRKYPTVINQINLIRVKEKSFQ